jgi:hypothetical protein
MMVRIHSSLYVQVIIFSCELYGKFRNKNLCSSSLGLQTYLLLHLCTNGVRAGVLQIGWWYDIIPPYRARSRHWPFSFRINRLAAEYRSSNWCSQNVMAATLPKNVIELPYHGAGCGSEVMRVWLYRIKNFRSLFCREIISRSLM